MRAAPKGVEGRPSTLRGRRGVALLAGLGVGFFLFWFVWIPYPWRLDHRVPERTALMEERIRAAERAGGSLEIHREWVPLDRISPNLVRAVLVAEDQRFRDHRGIDWLALAEEVEWEGGADFSWWSTSDLKALYAALRYTWTHRDEVRGRSTLTQQLAKNLYFGTGRSFARKGMEYIVARRLERRLEKDRILELYLNLVEWGPGIFGVEAAARTYFGRSSAELTLEEAAALAGTLPHPLTSNPNRSPGEMRFRQGIILQRLRPPPAAAEGPPVDAVVAPTLDSTGTPQADSTDPSGADTTAIPAPESTERLPADTTANPAPDSVPN